jgi:hypothetical protein
MAIALPLCLSSQRQSGGRFQEGLDYGLYADRDSGDLFHDLREAAKKRHEFSQKKLSKYNLRTFFPKTGKGSQP